MKNKLKNIWLWVDDRGGVSELLKPLFTHLVPPGATWNYVWGSSTLLCLVVQVMTGIALSFLYQPSAGAAYDSLLYIEKEAFLGSFIRGLHNWGASGMIFLMGIHMIRVYLSAAYKYPREMSWITGVLLLGLTVVMGFTGQLLRWDSNGVWSAIVAAEQIGRVPFIGEYLSYFLLGGRLVDGESLNRFFAMHTFLFPAMLFFIVGYHLFLVFRNGISEPPKAGRPVDPKTYRKWYKDLLKREGVPFFPFGIWRDAVAAGVVLVILLILAYTIGAPELTDPPSLTNIKASPEPDWYFTWIFALLALMPRKIEPYIIWIAPLIGITLLFGLPFFSNKGERSPLRRPWAIGGVVFVIASVGSLLYIGFKKPWSPHFKTKKITEEIVAGPSPDVLNGIHLYNAEGCLYCHKMGDKGGIRGPDLTNVQNRMSREQLVLRIINGSPDMPAYGSSLNKEELNDLVEFLMQKDKGMKE